MPSQHTWLTGYDANDRVTSETDALGHATVYAYDGAGHRTSVTDRNGNTTTYAYDQAGRLQTVKQKPDPAGQPTLVYTTRVTRDDNGNATTVTQANGVATDYGYDALDRLTAVTTHPTSTTSLATLYTLDGNGNTVTRAGADTVTTSYTYDAMSRLTAVAASGLTTIGYGYDSRSQRTSMSDGTGSSSFTYDGLGRLTQAVQPNGTTSYGYDLDSNRTSLTYPGSATVTYSFSNAGRLSSLTDWASRTATYAYTPAGLASTVTLPASLGGLVTSYNYDRAQRLVNLTNAIGSTTITSHTYALDNEGDRTILDEFVSGITAPATTDEFTMTYDGLLRLASVGTTNPESFTLDAASNLSSRTGPAATYTYDTSNRLASDGTQTFTWSNADRLTGRGNDSFGYDPLDRLTSATVSGTARTYAYNGAGLLQSRSAATSDTFLWDPATSPSRLLMQNGDKIVYGLGPLYAVKADGSTVAFARDGGKSVRAEVSSSGAVTSAFRYRAYGSLIQWSGAASPSYLGYAGQLVDPSGLLYMRARWYDPVSARFMTHDPLAGAFGAPASSNAFGYGNGNPVLNTDPTGMCVCWNPRGLMQSIGREWTNALSGTQSPNAVISAVSYVEIAAAGIFVGAVALAAAGPEVAVGGGAVVAQKVAERSALARPVMVIGETSRRVEAFASRIGAETYVEDEATQGKTLVERGITNLDNLAAWMQEGGAVYDLGLDPDRTQRGFFYFLESGLMEASQYPYWVKIAGIQ